MGVLGAIVGYLMMGSRELNEVAAAFHKRLFKTDVVAPEKDII